MSRGAVVVRVGRESEGVRIRVQERMHPDRDDYWDGNWMVSPVEVRAGGFLADVPAALRLDELRSFREQLEQLLAGTADIAVLDSLEEWLSLRIVRHGDRLVVRGVVTDSPGQGSRLEFPVVGLSLSDLPSLIDDLRSVETAFPIRGSRQPPEV